MKTLRRLLFFALALGACRPRDARRHQRLLRRRRRHGLRPLPRDPAHGGRLGGLQPPQREVQGLPRQLLHGRPAHAPEEPLARVAPLARRVAGADPHPPPGRGRRSSSAAARVTARSWPTGRPVPTARRTPRSSSTPSTTPASSSWTTACAATRCTSRAASGTSSPRSTGRGRGRSSRRSTRACRRCPAWRATPSTAKGSRSRRGATAGSWPAPRRRSLGPRSRSTTGGRSSTWGSTGCRCRR